MATADEQIRVSGWIKRELDKRRREGESYNDVLERLLGEYSEASFDDGFGMLSDEQANCIRERHKEAKAKRKRRSKQLDEDR